MPVTGNPVDFSPLIGQSVDAVKEMGFVVIDMKGDTLVDVGDTVTVFGDINAFTQGITGAGIFQAGFFPIMMFGLPAVGAAIAMNADKEHRNAV